MKKTSKLLITALMLTVLMTVFAISASAAGTGTQADPYTGAITADTTWSDGSYVSGIEITGGTSSDYLVIEVSGTVTVNDSISIISGGDSSNYKHVLIRGVGNGATLKAATGFGISSSTRAGVINVQSYAKLKLENITIDANSYTFNESTGQGTVTNSNRNLGIYLETGSLSFVDIGEGTVITGSSSVVGAVGPWGQVTLNGGTITKNSGAGLYVDNNSSNFVINSGTVSYNGAGNASAYGGGIRVRRGTLTINGGSICNNYANRGGGISADTANTATHKVTVVMNGGYISNNQASGSTAHGGGVYLNKAANSTSVTFTMNGGEISGNVAAGNGGGVAPYSNSVFTMNGGTITGNKANGGAILGTATVNLVGGTITGNYSNSTTSGSNGGVHMSGGVLNVYSTATIDNNYCGKSAESDPDVETININFSGTTELNAYYLYNSTNEKDLASWNTHVFDDYSNASFTLAQVLDNSRSNPGEAAILIDGAVHSGAISVPDGINVTLRGKNGTSDTFFYVGDTSNRVISVRTGGTLTIENVTVSAEKSRTNTRVAVVEAGGILNIKDGALLTGGKGVSGAGIYNQGTVSMTGGTISGNNAKGGAGGVNNNGADAVFNISGGTITGNTATQEGAGIYSLNGATLAISGDADISGNTVYNKEANVCIAPESSATTTVDAAFTGKVGFHGEFTTALSYTLGTIPEALCTAGNVTLDESGFTSAWTSDVLTITTTAKDFTVKSPNGNITVSATNRGFISLRSITAPAGYDADDFVGFVKVSGYGTNDAKAEAIYTHTLYSPEELENIYATWVKVETLKGASAAISANSGIKFITTVDSAILESVGIKVKSSADAGDGYYRGTLLATSASDITGGLTADTARMNVKITNTGWNTASYSKYTGSSLAAGKDSFAATVIYNSDNYYNNAVAYRGYIEIVVGDSVVTIMSDFTAPTSMSDTADATYDDVHANSACAIVRKSYFSGTYTEQGLKTLLGEDNYAVALKIAGYTQFPSIDNPATAAKLAYYL